MAVFTEVSGAHRTLPQSRGFQCHNKSCFQS